MPKYAYARPGSSWLESVGAKQTLERMRTRIKMSQTLKRKLADQAVGTILVTMNLVWNDGSGTVTVLLLDAAICWHGFVSSLREASCFRGFFPQKYLLVACLVRSILDSRGERYPMEWRERWFDAKS